MTYCSRGPTLATKKDASFWLTRPKIFNWQKFFAAKKLAKLIQKLRFSPKANGTLFYFSGPLLIEWSSNLINQNFSILFSNELWRSSFGKKQKMCFRAFSEVQRPPNNLNRTLICWNKPTNTSAWYHRWQKLFPLSSAIYLWKTCLKKCFPLLGFIKPFFYLLYTLTTSRRKT